MIPGLPCIAFDGGGLMLYIPGGAYNGGPFSILDIIGGGKLPIGGRKG